jgi:hypothetical protein
MNAAHKPLQHLPEYVERFRSWSIKQRSLAKRNGPALLAYVPAPPSPDNKPRKRRAAAH